MKSKTTTGILALIFGGIGLHKFYLGKIWLGILYLLFCWTLIPSLIGVIEGIVYLLMPNDKFNLKYNTRYFVQSQKVMNANPSVIKSSEPIIEEIKESEVVENKKAVITSEAHRFHKTYKRLFEKNKDKIEAGETICLSELEEKYVQQFCDIYLPSVTIQAVRPIIIKTTLAGLEYHDYKKKAVKEILDNDPFAFLDLLPEPTNKYDLYAVKLMIEGYFLGYVPSQYCKKVAEAIKENKDVTCMISDYQTSGRISERIQIEIEIREK